MYPQDTNGYKVNSTEECMLINETVVTKYNYIRMYWMQVLK